MVRETDECFGEGPYEDDPQCWGGYHPHGMHLEECECHAQCAEQARLSQLTRQNADLQHGRGLSPPTVQQNRRLGNQAHISLGTTSSLNVPEPETGDPWGVRLFWIVARTVGKSVCLALAHHFNNHPIGRPKDGTTGATRPGADDGEQ
jgi:hypothetical protein